MFHILSFNIVTMKGEVTGSSERCVALLTALRSLLQVMIQMFDRR